MLSTLLLQNKQAVWLLIFLRKKMKIKKSDLWRFFVIMSVNFLSCILGGILICFFMAGLGYFLTGKINNLGHELYMFLKLGAVGGVGAVIGGFFYKDKE